MDSYQTLALILILLLILLISVLTSRNRIIKTYEKYMKINNQANMSGKDIAIYAKQKLQLEDLKFGVLDNKLCDAYSPKHNILILSKEVCETASLSSLTIVAHELGHAMQHKNKSILFFISRLLNGITKFFNKFIIPLLVIGLFLFLIKYPNQDVGLYLMITSGGLFTIHVFNQILNIPLEYDASRRALKFLKNNKLLNPSEYKKAKKLLNTAAQTYIANLFDGLFILNKKKRIK